MSHEPDFVRDTDPKALEVFYQIQRRRSPGEKANDVFELTDWMIQLAERDVKTRYPGISEREVFLRACALRIPRDLMIQAYGWIRKLMGSVRDAAVRVGALLGE